MRRIFLFGMMIVLSFAALVRAQQSITFMVFIDRDSLTFYQEIGTVDIGNVGIRVSLGNSNDDHFLRDYTSFNVFLFNTVPAPICLRLMRFDGIAPVPTICNGKPILFERLAPADAFWWDVNGQQTRTLLFMQEEIVVGICPAGSTSCDLTVAIPTFLTLPAPSNNIVIVPSPTLTNIPVDFPTPLPINTPLVSTTPDALEVSRTFNGTRNADWIPTIREFDGVEMVLVPIGCFMMGVDSVTEDASPEHQVCFDTPFWIDRYEVTQSQFRFFNGQANSSSQFTGPLLPRENITWYEAVNFCESRDAHLSSEAEWEYAARGVESWIYPWGNEFFGNRVVYILNSNNQTANVGSRLGGISWVGALDMSGNVWEWVSTIYDQERFPYPYRPTDGRENMIVVDNRVLRGGAWNNSDINIRAVVRDGGGPYGSNHAVGFRCARDM